MRGPLPHVFRFHIKGSWKFAHEWLLVLEIIGGKTFCLQDPRPNLQESREAFWALTSVLPAATLTTPSFVLEIQFPRRCKNNAFGVGVILDYRIIVFCMGLAKLAKLGWMTTTMTF